MALLIQAAYIGAGGQCCETVPAYVQHRGRLWRRVQPPVPVRGITYKVTRRYGRGMVRSTSATWYATGRSLVNKVRVLTRAL